MRATAPCELLADAIIIGIYEQLVGVNTLEGKEAGCTEQDLFTVCIAWGVSCEI